MKARVFCFIGVLAVLLVSCDRGDQEIKKFYRGEGIWTIESIQYDTYDVSGTSVVSSTSVTEPGELVFFRSKTMSAFYDRYMVIANMKDANGTVIANPGQVYFDGNRAEFREDADVNHNFPDELEGLWTVEVDERKFQEWAIYSSSPTNVLVSKKILKLKKK